MPFAKRIQDFSAAASTRLVVLPPWNFFPWFHGGKNQEATECLQVFETNLRSKVRSGTEACGRGKLMALQQPQTGGSSRSCRAIPRGGQLVRSSALRRAVRQRSATACTFVRADLGIRGRSHPPCV